MISLLKWLLGYIAFTFEGGFSDGFINECYQSKYNIQNIKRNGAVLTAECPAELYPYLRQVARKNGGRLRIDKKRGIIFILAKIKTRWGLFFGAVVGIIFISFISGFVWNIDITGNSVLSETQLRGFLNDNGFYEGAYWREVDRDVIENLLLASFDDIAWAHINRDGTSARVEINESVIRPKTVKRKKYCNVKAKKSGVIVKATVYDGWGKVKKGDAVNKGDLLISGIYSGEKKVNLFTHARGKYIAEVKEKFSLTVNRNQSYKRYISEERRQTLIFFNIQLPLYIGKTPKNAETESEERRIVLNGKKLPVGIRESTIRVYKNEVKTLSDRELTQLINSETEKKIKSDFAPYQIIKKKIKTELGGGSATAKGYVLCLEDIGQEVRIKVKKTKK